MFGKSNKPSPIDSLIGPGTVIEGNVSFKGGLRVDGCIRGSVTACDDKTGTLVVSEQATIEGAVQGRHIVINGTVAGPVAASEYVELLPKARVTGDVTYKAVEIHSGAIVMGRLQHQASFRGDKVVDIKSAGGVPEPARLARGESHE